MAKPMTVTLGILGVLLLVGGTAAVSWLFLSGQTAQQTALAPSNIQATFCLVVTKHAHKIIWMKLLKTNNV